MQLEIANHMHQNWMSVVFSSVLRGHLLLVAGPFNNMSIFLDIFSDDDDDDILMLAFGGFSMSSIFKSGIFSEKQCGSIDDHEKQEAQSVVQDPDIEESQVDLQEGCKDEQSVEDQFDEPHEADGEDVAEEDRAGENLKCDNLINIYVCADDNIAEIYMRDTRNGERKQFPIKHVITFKRARISIQAFHHWGRNEPKIHHLS